jgi:hypothetical protein
MVMFDIRLDIDLYKIYKVLKKRNYNTLEYVSSIGESYEKFWYCFNEVSGIRGPFTIDELKALYDKSLITKSTFIWHPILDKWQYYICTKELVKGKKELPPEVDILIESLKTNNELLPVYLKQGYIHMRKKPPTKDIPDRIVWLMMTENSLLVRDTPEDQPFLELNLIDLQFFPETQASTGDLSFTVGSTRFNGQNFYSSFQREVLEWINEVRKLRYYREKKMECFIEMFLCVPGQSNLIVMF